MEAYRFSRERKSSGTVVDVSGVKVGGREIVIAAGPCSVESEEQLMDTAKGVIGAGAGIIRGGAFKPRTSPYSFQGLGKEGLGILKEAGRRFDVPIVTELMDTGLVELYSRDVDLIQVGARNSQNFDMLKRLGKQKRPVLLKNGTGTSVQEWLMSSEYVLSEGNSSVILCYRGAKSIEGATRFSMDMGAIAMARKLSHMLICVDPSHAAGRREFVAPMALAAIAAGADMLEIEVHNDPDKALSDREQQLSIGEFEELMNRARDVAKAVGRSIRKG